MIKGYIYGGHYMLIVDRDRTAENLKELYEYGILNGKGVRVVLVGGIKSPEHAEKLAKEKIDSLMLQNRKEKENEQ